MRLEDLKYKKIDEKITRDDAVDSINFVINSYPDIFKKISCEPNTYMSIREEEKNMEILKIYRNKYFEKLNNEYGEKIKKIKSEDPIQMVLNDTLNHIKEILEIEEDYSQEKIYFIEDKLKINNYTSDTERLLNEIGKEKNEKIKELNNLLEEITAMLSMTNDYQEQIKILKNYGIIDKKTNKLNV